jgi:ferritin-like metal-binding protein YciE
MNAPGINSSLNTIFAEQLQRAYWAEKKMVKTLPKLRNVATTLQLKNAFDNHLEQTKTHINRLEKVFSLTNEELYAKKCPVMAGIVKEELDSIEETDDGSAQRDVALIIAAQKAEHYEIATYGGLAQLAKTLGYNEAKEILGQILSEEKETDTLLTQIAESGINYQASLETHESANG